jgi:hypothetical protein
MKKKLKLKILSGFLLLIALLAVAGTVSIIEFQKLSCSVNQLIEDNYKTIESAREMLEALERTDSGVLLMLLGERDEGLTIIHSAKESFSKSFVIAQNNITEVNEDKYIANIKKLYDDFIQKIDQSIIDKEKGSNINWYQGETYKSFLEVKHAVDELMSLNQSSMYGEASLLVDKSHRAIMPGIVAIVGALIFSLILSFFISKYYISPLSSLTEAIKGFHPSHKTLRSNIKTEDEIKRIEIEVNKLIERLLKQQVS